MLLMSLGACQGHVFLAFTQSSCSKQSLGGWKSGQLGLGRLSCGESGRSHPCSFSVDPAYSGGIGGSGNTTRGNRWSLWKRGINLVSRPTEPVVCTLLGVIAGTYVYLCVMTAHGQKDWCVGWSLNTVSGIGVG